ncbi:hypothetical protein CPB86DRAFT_838505 [Serendipita vermifera]|nr:hypothetical protein CPB86DRAFT_838505 [Serendipita vermifera]
MVYGTAGVPISLPSSTWRLCPNLRTLHTFLTNIAPYLRPPPAYPPFCLIFGEFGCSDYWRDDPIYYHWASYMWFDYEVLLSLFLALSWPVEEFEMDFSWHILQNWLMNTPYHEDLEMMYNCLERMLWVGRDVKDRYGAGILSTTASALMNWMESLIEDPNRRKEWWEEVKAYKESDAEFTEGEDEDEYWSETEDSDIDGAHFLFYGDYGDSDEDDSNYVEDDMDMREVHTYDQEMKVNLVPNSRCPY